MMDLQNSVLSNPLFGFILIRFKKAFDWKTSDSKKELIQSLLETASIDQLNLAFLQQIQLPKEEVLKLDLCSFFNADAARVKRLLFRIFNLGQAPFEIRTKKAHNEFNYLKAIYFPLLTAERKIGGIYGIQQDISTQRRNEKQLVRRRQDLTNMNNRMQLAALMGRLAYWTYSIPKKTLTFSDELDGMLNIERNGQAFGLLDFKKRIHPKDWGLFISSMLSCIKNGKPFKIEIRVLLPDQSPISLEIKGQPRYNELNRYEEVFGIARDITEERKLRVDLKKALVQAEAGSKSKSEFLANMSHEIRTPLNAILGYSELLETTELNAKQKGYLSIVKQTGNSLIEIVNDILDVSKIEAGKMELDQIPVSLHQFFHELRQVVSYHAMKKNVSIVFQVAKNLSPYMVLDPVRLRQVLLNLLSNAIKFTDKGKVVLQVSKLKEDDGLHQLLFEVKDTGKGIHPDQLQQIFELFTQEDISITRSYGGTGLGLNISNGILNLMNSKLKVESTQGVGSNFYFDVWLHPHSEEMVNSQLVISDIIYVGEDESFFNELNACKKQFELKMEHVHTGLELMHRLKNRNLSDLIIIDEEQDYMSNLELARFIQEKHSMDHFAVLCFTEDTYEADLDIFDHHRFYFLPSADKNVLRLKEFMADLPFELNEKKRNPFEYQRIDVMIVEDNAINMGLFEAILNMNVSDILIHKAINGQEAIDLFKQLERKPDIIFMDIQMPIVDGYQATSGIRMLPGGNNIPIVAVSAGILKGEQDKAIQSGMNDFISKPVNQNAIIDALKKYVPIQSLSPKDEEKNSAILRNRATPKTTIAKSLEIPEELALFDESTLMESIGFDQDLKQMLFDKTLSYFEEIPNILQQSLDAHNLKQFDRDLHELIGVCRSMQLNRLTKFGESFRLEKELNEKQMLSFLSRLISLIEETKKRMR